MIEFPALLNRIFFQQTGDPSTFTIFLLSLLMGILLDRFFADPSVSMHPVRLIGLWISVLERRFNRGEAKQKIINGFFAVALTVLPVLFFFILLELFSLFFASDERGIDSNSFLFGISNAFPILRDGLFVFLFVASEGLIREGCNVMAGLDAGIAEGRIRLSRIVGRDTAEIDEQGVRRALLETMSENLSDGVIAPLFYFALGGIPLMAAYKAVNTLDSMIAYRNDRFLYFGRVAARLDDIANYFPARITAILYILVSGRIAAIRDVMKFAPLHDSPNAGYPESALATILKIRLGGPAVYHGEVKNKAWLGEVSRDIDDSDFKRAIHLNRRALSLFIVIVISLRFCIEIIG